LIKNGQSKIYSDIQEKIYEISSRVK
jgi:hypothetical protein